MARAKLTDEQIRAQIPAARAAAWEAANIEPRAADVDLDRRSRRLLVELKNGCAFLLPLSAVEGLNRASFDEILSAEIEPDGEAIHWESLDVDVSVPGLIARLLNLREWAPRYLGRITSEAKARAARENGQKGGRPRKRERGEDAGAEAERFLRSVPGIGPRRQKALMAEFHTLASLGYATAEELSRAANLPLPLAERIHEALEEQGAALRSRTPATPTAGRGREIRDRNTVADEPANGADLRDPAEERPRSRRG